MPRIALVAARLGQDLRNVFRIRRTGDGSMVLETPKRRDAHVTLHETGDFHVQYEGRKLTIKLPGGQRLSTFRGLSSPCEYVISKPYFHILKHLNPASSPDFTVDLGTFGGILVAVKVVIFDTGRLAEFNRFVGTLNNPVQKIIITYEPKVGLIAHEPK